VKFSLNKSDYFSQYSKHQTFLIFVTLAFLLVSCNHVTKSNSASFFFERANSKSKNYDYNGAIADLNLAIDKDPYFAVAYYNRAVFKFKKGDYDGAVADIGKYLELKPRDALAYNYRAIFRSFKNEDDYDQEIADNTRAIELAPQFEAAYTDRGCAKYMKHDYEGANADFDRAIELKPDNGSAYVFRAAVKNDSYDYNGAVADIDRALLLKLSNNDLAMAYFIRGIAKGRQGNYYGALLDYDKALQHGQDKNKIYFTRSETKLVHGNLFGAIEDLDKAIELQSKDPKIYYNRGLLEVELGKYQSAIQFLDKSIDLDPKFAIAFWNRALIYERLGKFELAIQNYRKVREIIPERLETKAVLDNLFSILNGNPQFIKKIQYMLSELGYYKDEINGDLEASRSAINNFQRMKGIEITAEVNDETHALLTKEYYLAIHEQMTMLNSNTFFINYPKNGSETTESSIFLDAVFNAESEIEKIIVRNNGKQIEGFSDFDFNKDRTTANMDLKIPLAEGENQISLIAITKKGQFKTKVNIVYKPNVITQVRKKWAVIIGIEDYDDNRIRDLYYSVDDAEDLAEILIKRGGFQPENIILITDKMEKNIKGVIRETPTYENIRTALLSFLKKKTTSRDTVIIYYSGHGLLTTDTFSPTGMSAFLAPKDIDFSSPVVRGIRFDEIKSLAYLAPERIFLILDSCFSGGDIKYAKTFTTEKGKPIVISNEIVKGFSQIGQALGKGRVLLSSSLHNQASQESEELKHGIFTYYLLDILNADEKRISEIYGYVYDNVIRFTNNEQEPVIDIQEQKGTLLFY